MSAGVQPEGFTNYMLDVHTAAIHAIRAVGEYDQKVMIPALIMALTSVVKIYVEEGRFESMDFGINLVHEGLDALADDYKREMEGPENGN